ncbi:M18 family aminopeptidase [Diplocloster modestus]|uniref:M18 family aminopeptidase n=1 Tax=Diplocloster modestus TaxID=2850322 RepID=A0ABS6K2S1_9FIRM|nr:M18 family aminopeptidase [Diplocloster modestus]MBU9724818.1 M18 family aminopeptidase [Diplocloster modestus]
MSTMEHAEKLLQLTETATSSFHTVEAAVRQLKDAGFTELDSRDDWGLTSQGKYYVVHHGSSLAAFTVGSEFSFREGFRIAAAHTDFPGLRLKPHPEMDDEGYGRVNVEVYGGAILNTWLDRPLSMAGRVALRGEDAFHPVVRLMDVKRPVLTIPNLAIHLNKEINKGIELNKQTDMLPVAGMIGEKLNKEDFLIRFLANELHTKPENILDYEIGIYNADAGDVIGMDGEFISAPRLDNLTSVQALLTGLMEGERRQGINVIALFDHEEIGSRTKQGAGSLWLNTVLEKIMAGFGRDRNKYLGTLEESFLLSVDVGHAIHPGSPAKSDPTNKNKLNGGVCIKEASAQSYATDCEAIAIVQQICEQEGILYQKFANRSDGTSGGTLGSIASSVLPVRTVDVGVPLLAMHSSRELMGTEDQESLVRLVRAYFGL